MKNFILLLFLFTPACLFAQKVITHKVQPKESYSSIGRTYNINGRTLAEYNGLDYNAGLSIGQVIKVPVQNQTNATPAPPPPPVASVATNVNAGNGSPIYHTVTTKQTLYGISKMYPQATIDNIRKWNNIPPNDGVKDGQVIIVGYGAGTAAVNSKPEPAVVTKNPTPTNQEPGDDDFDVIGENNKKKEEAAAKAEQQKIEKEAERKKKLEEEAKKLEEEKQEAEAARLRKEKADLAKKQAAKPGEGIFATEYSGAEAKTANTLAGVFKSTSGWEDGRFYGLYDDVRPGTIVKVTNTANNKVVYVKILDMVPKLQQNKGIGLRLSNAAANQLGLQEENFMCSISF